MPIDNQTAVQKEPVLEFKSRSINVPALILFSNQLDEIEQQLQQKISQAPDFFKHSPLVIDLHELEQQRLLVDIPALVSLLCALKLVIIGIQGGSKKQHDEALELGIPVFSLHISSNTKEKEETESLDAGKSVEAEPVSPIKSITKIISQPVRSGQRVYTKGDLIILAQVSAGAEVMAEGNIHVYGALRGRALAGVQGDTESRIFCFDLQAELVSIAGNYRLSDDIDASLGKKPMQIFLHDQALIIEEL